MDKMNRYTKLSIIALLVLLLVIFVVQNAAIVELKFLFWSVSMRRVVMIIGVFAIGFIAAWIIKGFYAHREIDYWRERYKNLRNKSK